MNTFVKKSLKLRGGGGGGVGGGGVGGGGGRRRRSRRRIRTISKWPLNTIAKTKQCVGGSLTKLQYVASSHDDF